MTTIANGSRPVLAGVLTRVLTKVEAFASAWKRRRAAFDAAWLDHHFEHRRAARERYLARAKDHYELERLERAFDRGDGEIWRVY